MDWPILTHHSGLMKITLGSSPSTLSRFTVWVNLRRQLGKQKNELNTGTGASIISADCQSATVVLGNQNGGDLRPRLMAQSGCYAGADVKLLTLLKFFCLTILLISSVLWKIVQKG